LLQQFMRATKLRKHAETMSRLNLTTLEAGHGPNGRYFDVVPRLKQQELQQLQGGRQMSPSPINLTPANNNVFNFTSDRMEHAIPADAGTETSSVASEHTRLLGGSHHGTAVGYTQPHARYMGSAESSGSAGLLTGLHAEEGSTSWWELITLEVGIILVLYVVNKVGQELVISSIPMVTQAEFGWSREGGGYYMTVVGASVLPMILLINKFLKDAEERELVLHLSYASLACLVLMLHFTALGEYTMFQYVIGSIFLFASLNALEGVVMALLAKLISPELAKGTFNSGLLATEAGTFGRVVGDMCITIFGSAEEPVNGMFLPVAVMVAASIGLVWCFFDRLE
jgi:uncharacterized membrane protein YeaQ/YmgE (transglycosylase-associated protein family)